jgi:iron complex outermembrane receptor protein
MLANAALPRASASISPAQDCSVLDVIDYVPPLPSDWVRRLLLGGSVLAILAGPAYAQSATTAADGAVEEVVVTAQKRTERLQDVPLAVTAVSGEALSRQQINDTTSLTRAVPSLSFQPGATSNGAGFRIRGIGTQLFSLGVEASVSVVVDGIVAARQTQSFADFADIERIEVLRGPQGTLFGKNATAGVISIVTARPTGQLSGGVDATVAEGDEYRIKGTVSGPLTESLRGRLSGYYNDVGGHIRNRATGKDVNGFESWGVRGKLEWNATADLNFLLMADYRENESDCCNTVYVALVNPALAQLNAPISASRRNRQINEDVIGVNRDLQTTVSLQGDWDLGPATVTSITAYQRYKNDANNPVDKLNNPVPAFIGAAAFSKFDVNGGLTNLEQFSQELRIGSNGEGDLTYVVGAFYSDVTVDRDFFRRRAVCAAGVLGQPCPAPVFQSSSLASRNKTESLAGFGQVEYRLYDSLKVLAGLRVQRETTSAEGARFAAPIPGDSPIPGNAANAGRRSASDTAVTGKAGLKYEFNRNAQAYGTYTRGYKGLGFNTELATDFAAQAPVQPEHVDAYELGFKGRTSDGRISVALAAFLADYTDLQIQANRSDPTTGLIQFVQTNAGSSQTKGFEIEATIRPVDPLSIALALTYADSKIDVNGLNCPLQFQAAAQTLTGNFPVNTCYRSQLRNAAGVLVTSGPIQDVRGGRLPYAPKYRLSLTPRYESEIPGTRLIGFGQLGVNYQSRAFFALEQDPLLTQKGYVLVDASVGVRDGEGRYTASIFVRNLFDEHYVSAVGHAATLATTANSFDLVSFVNKDADRYVGINLGYRF